MAAIPVPPPVPQIRAPAQQQAQAGPRAGPPPAPPGFQPQMQQRQQMQQGQLQPPFQLPMRPLVESVRISDITPHKLFDEDYAKKQLTNYRAFTIRKLPVKDPKKEKTTWARAEVMEERISEPDIAKQIKRLNETSRKSVADKKGGLADFQTRQVNKILDELLSEEFDPNFEWSLAQIDQKFRTLKTGQKETSTLTVYVKRAPKPGQNPLHLLQNIERNKVEAEVRQRQHQQHQQQLEMQQRQHQLAQQQQAMQHQQQQQQAAFANSKIPSPIKMIKGERKDRKYRDDTSASSAYDSDSSHSSGYSSSQGTSISSRSRGRAKKYHKSHGRNRSKHRVHHKNSYLDGPLPADHRYRDPRLYNGPTPPVPAVDEFAAGYQAAKVEADAERIAAERIARERLIPRIIPDPGTIISYGRRDSFYPERPHYTDRGERIYAGRREHLDRHYGENPRYVDDRYDDYRSPSDEEYRIRRAEEHMERDRRASEPRVVYTNPFSPKIRVTRFPPSPPPMSHSSY